MKHLPVRFMFVFCLGVGLSLPGILRVGADQFNSRIPDDLPAPRIGDIPGVPATVFVKGSTPPAQQTPVSFPTLSPTPTLRIELLATPTPARVFGAVTQVELAAFVHAPPGALDYPYVILTAFSSAPFARIEIRGNANLVEFVCTDSPCGLPLTESVILVFKAYDDQGNTSQEVLARIRVERAADKYHVIIDSVNQFTLFRDACSDLWRVEDEIQQPWSEFPQSPFELNTDKTLHLLAANLIASGIVDAGDCPAGGLGPGGEWPTGCGLQRARTKMIEWQNQFDFQIWSASMEVGIPPKLLKTILEYESQFWPLNERFYVDEIGLGQINQLGIDVLLRQDPALYQQICPTVFSDCSLPYTSQEAPIQAMIRGAVLTSINADCPSCEHGVDLNKANQSIPLVAELIKSNCQMVEYLDVAGREAVEYDDLWRFTLASYHSGYSCIENAIKVNRQADHPEDWEHVSLQIECKDTRGYVDGFWDNLLSFDAYLLDEDSFAAVQVAPTFLPTRTPIPPPTAIPSEAKVWVRAYIDANRNGEPEEAELLDGITVEILLRNQQRLSAKTVKGEVLFDMNGYPAGMDGIVSLPGLYHEQLISLPLNGIVQVDFVFAAPAIPEQLP